MVSRGLEIRAMYSEDYTNMMIISGTLSVVIIVIAALSLRRMRSKKPTPVPPSPSAST
ncbi:MAG: hypothetical protein QXU11_01170 [Thermoproteota archaeon]